MRHRARVRPLRLLVADDQPANLMVLRRLLEKAGHQAQTVDSGEDVLAALEDGHFDGVIIDLHMPGVSGLDVLKQVRVMEAGAQALTPFIVLSADATAATVRACEQAGARAFLTKPIAVNRLLDALADVALGSSETQIKPAQIVAEAQAAETVISRNVLEELQELQLGNDFLGAVPRRMPARCAEEHRRARKDRRSRTVGHVPRSLPRAEGRRRQHGRRAPASVASETMRLGNWQLAREWRQRIRSLREQLEVARIALKTASTVPQERNAGPIASVDRPASAVLRRGVLALQTAAELFATRRGARPEASSRKR